MTRRSWCGVMVAAVAAAGPAPLGAQTELTLEIGASQVGPALGSDIDDTRFGMGGLRLSARTAGGSGLFASVLGGRVLGSGAGASFLTGFIEGTGRQPWSERWSGSVDVRFVSFDVRNPFPQRTWATELEPAVEMRTTHTALRLGVMSGLGHTRAEFWRRRLGDTIVVEDDHWRIGASGELLFGSPTVQVGIAGSTHSASGDRFRSAGGRFVVGGGWGVVELKVDRWTTPLGDETTGGLSMSIPFGGWSVRSFVGRSDPDPMTLAQPGSGSGGVLLGRRLYSSRRDLTRGTPYEVLRPTPGGATVRITLDAPPGATRVEVLGDFTLWDPVPMQSSDGGWSVEIDVEAGTHHFGFLVDDQWYVPDDIPDVVPDEWGRLSAILVIEGAG